MAPLGAKMIAPCSAAPDMTRTGRVRSRPTRFADLTCHYKVTATFCLALTSFFSSLLCFLLLFCGSRLLLFSLFLVLFVYSLLSHHCAQVAYVVVATLSRR